jgi:hypothetical protein
VVTAMPSHGSARWSVDRRTRGRLMVSGCSLLRQIVQNVEGDFPRH